VHKYFLIHRDMKPDNFLIGNENHKTIYVIDFGLAKYYKDPETGKHISYRANKKLTGTARYASIATHMGIEQSRRDDLEGICYIMLYFIKRELPWQGLPAATKEEKYRKIKEVKQKSSSSVLTQELPSMYCELV